MECVDVIKSEKNNGSHSADTKGWVLGKYALDLFIDLDFGFTYLSQNIRSSSFNLFLSFFFKLSYFIVSKTNFNTFPRPSHKQCLNEPERKKVKLFVDTLIKTKLRTQTFSVDSILAGCIIFY